MTAEVDTNTVSINIPPVQATALASQTDSPNPDNANLKATNDSLQASNTPTNHKNSQSKPDQEQKFQSVSKSGKQKGKTWGIFAFLVILESLTFACVTILLIATLTADKLHNSVIWDLGLWKWCLLMLTILCGRLISNLITKFMLFLIWRFCVHEKVLYFAYGVRKSVLFFIWVSLVTLVWGLMANHGVDRSMDTSHIVNKDVFRGIAGCLIVAFLWLMKTLLVKLVGSIHATKLLDKIKEAICTRKLLVALAKEKSGENQGHFHLKTVEKFVDSIAYKVFNKCPSSQSFEKEKISRDTMIELMYAIRGKRLLSLPHGDETNDNGNDKKPDEAAKEAAKEIFDVLKLDPSRCISLEYLLQHVKDKKVIDQLTGLAEEQGEKKVIEESVFRDWLIEVYREHDSLNSTLKHSKTAMDELNVIASVIVLLISAVIWLLFMEFLNTKLLVFLSSQLVLAVFMFGNTVKTVFEAVIFVFLVHPFDVGDRCVIDGVQMVVDEMNILTTTFLRYDNEKIYYPNAVLASKPISNLYRSPPMSETVEFAISLHTPEDIITDLQEKIKTYLEENPKSWRPDHSLQFREIEDVNKMKVAIFVNHTVNFHYIGKRMKRRSDLIRRMKNIFQELGIEYRLLPQQIDITSLHQNLHICGCKMSNHV